MGTNPEILPLPLLDPPKFASARGRPAHAEKSAENNGAGGAQGPDQTDYQGLAGFRLALRRFLAFSDAATSSAGVSSQQYQALLVIRTQPDEAVSIKVLAEQLLLVPNGAVQLVDRLEASGLVTRRKSPLDGRSVLVGMTREGEDVLDQLAAAHAAELTRQRPLLVESLRRLKKIGQ